MKSLKEGENPVDYDEIIEQGILYNFKAYEVPRLATYSSPGNTYKLPIGWIDVPKTVLVIGEDDHCFITELRASEHGEWTDKRILYKYILPLGFHKTRLIQWEETQLTLF